MDSPSILEKEQNLENSSKLNSTFGKNFDKVAEISDPWEMI